MREFKLLSLSFFLLFILGCEQKNANGMKKVHWDRDMCERCKMIISERHFAVQIVNEDTNKRKMFDDLGCAIIWFEEENIPWFDKAKIFINDASDGSWIDARTALYTQNNRTPMGYGISAYTKNSLPKDKESITFNQARKILIDVDLEYKKKRALLEAKRELEHE